jgi:hypothetical protein
VPFSPGSDPVPLPQRDPGGGHMRKGDTSKFCIVHRAPPGNRVPGSGPRAAPGSTESSEIGMGPPRAKFGPASSVIPPKQRYVIRFNPDLKLNLLRSQLGSNPCLRFGYSKLNSHHFNPDLCTQAEGLCYIVFRTVERFLSAISGAVAVHPA